MSFKITKQKFGTSAKTTIFEFETEIKVNDFCLVGEKGIVIAMDTGLALLNPENELRGSWAKVKNPKAVDFYKPTKTLFIIDGYKDIKKISMGCSNVANAVGKKSVKDFDRYFSKMRDEDKIDSMVDCSANKGHVYVVSGKINRCLDVNSSHVRVLAGNGSSGFSTATSLDACCLNNPSGVACYKGDIYIADTDNSCIRLISKGRKIKTIGCPKISDSIDSPSKIVVENDLIYFLDNNEIRYCNLDASNVGTIYKTENKVVSLDVGQDKFLYILEEV